MATFAVRRSALGRAAPAAAAWTATAALVASLFGAPTAVADTSAPSTQDIERSRATAAGTADRVGRIEAQLAAAAIRSDRLAADVGRAVEAYNGARLRLVEARAAVADAERRARSARTAVESAREALGRFAAAAYRSGGDLGSLSVVLVAENPQDLMTRAAALQSIGTTRRRAVEDFRSAEAYAHFLERRSQRLVAERRRAVRQVAAATDTAQARLAAQTDGVAAIAAQHETLVRQLAAARDTTVRLERRRQAALERQREAAARRAAQTKAREQERQAEEERQVDEERQADEPRPGAPPSTTEPPAPPTAPLPAPLPPAPPELPPAASQPPTGSSAGTMSGAEAAVAYARAQVGKPYEWGADGPGSFDCSGLTMRAWEQGGVSLPHYSVAQYEQAAKVPISDLRSGDLVFFASDPADYRSIYHVGLYIGGGQMVEAPYTGESVRISSIWRASLVGAARP